MKKLRLSSTKLHRPLIMGILNVTPDSFSGDGTTNAKIALKRAKQMVADGADIIDLGGESSRPGSEPVSENEELQRLRPVLEHLAGNIEVPLSIDTYKPRVAEECLNLGVSMINDITGLDTKMSMVAKKYNVPVVIMHMRGRPKTMQQNISYNDIIQDIKEFLKERVDKARKAGITDVIIDPGLGFGKTAEDNLKIIKRLDEFKSLGCPILVGPSRKSFIGNITGLPVSERLEGTIAAIAIAVFNGADIVRVHDVKECKRAVQVAEAIRGA